MRTAETIAITLVALAMAILVASYGLLRSGDLSARRKPGKFEYAVANYALSLSIPPAARSEKNPIAATSEVLVGATRYYSEDCAVCHGNDGAGKTNIAKGLSPEVPDLRAEHVQKLSDGQMFYVIRNGIRFTGMPGWDLRDEQIWKLVLVTRQFAREHAQPRPGEPTGE
jgi:mono/diheme cytochrome c family protein